jgi:hypothetical protein
LGAVVERADFDSPIVGDGTTLLVLFADCVGAGSVGVGGNNFATVFEVVTGVAEGVGFAVELVGDVVAGLGGGLLLVGAGALTFAELELFVGGAVGFWVEDVIELGWGASGLGTGALDVAELVLAAETCGVAEGVCFALELELEGEAEELFGLGSGSGDWASLRASSSR